MSTLYLIRHGQASAFKPVYDQLSEHGERQGAALGAWLVARGVEPARVYVGPRARHAQTCAQVAAVYQGSGLPWPEPVALEGLDEYPLHQLLLEVVPRMAQEDPEVARLGRAAQTGGRAGSKAFMTLLSDVGRRWLRGELDDAGYESWAGFVERLEGALEAMTADAGSGESVLAFTSAGTVAGMAGALMEASPEKALELSWTMINASVSRVLYSGARRSLVSLNEAPFLEERGWVTYR